MWFTTEIPTIGQKLWFTTEILNNGHKHVVYNFLLNIERPRAARSPSSRVELKRLKHCPVWLTPDIKFGKFDKIHLTSGNIWD